MIGWSRSHHKIRTFLFWINVNSGPMYVLRCILNSVCAKSIRCGNIYIYIYIYIYVRQKHCMMYTLRKFLSLSRFILRIVDIESFVLKYFLLPFKNEQASVRLFGSLASPLSSRGYGQVIMRQPTHQEELGLQPGTVTSIALCTEHYSQLYLLLVDIWNASCKEKAVLLSNSNDDRG